VKATIPAEAVQLDNVPNRRGTIQRRRFESVNSYVIGDLDVTDPKRLAEYAERVPQTIQKYGGRYLVRGGKFEIWEGDWKPKLLVIIEFPSRDAAVNWYNSEEYRPLKELRVLSARTNGVLVEGVDTSP
jgi:uncharacterized protein (DUF1330 family)